MATKAKRDSAGMHRSVIVGSLGILALTPQEVAEFIDTPESMEANVGTDELDEEYLLE